MLRFFLLKYERRVRHTCHTYTLPVSGVLPKWEAQTEMKKEMKQVVSIFPNELREIVEFIIMMISKPRVENVLGNGFKVCVSPDSSSLCSIGSMVRLWDVAKKEEVVSLEKKFSYYFSVDYSQDGKKLAFGHDGGILIYSSNLDPNSLFLLEDKKDRRTRKVRRTSFSTSGRYLVSGTKYGNSVKFWDVERGVALSTFNTWSEGYGSRDGSSTTVSIYPDERTIISGIQGKEIKLWDVRSEKCLLVRKTKCTPRELRFCRSFTHFVCAMDGSCQIYDSRYLRVVDEGRTKDAGYLACADYHPSENFVCCGSRHGTFFVYSPLPTENHPVHTVTREGRSFESVRFSPDGKFLVTASSRCYDSSIEENEAEEIIIWSFDINHPSEDSKLWKREEEEGEEEEEEEEKPSGLFSFLKELDLSQYFDKMNGDGVKCKDLGIFLEDEEALDEYIPRRKRFHRKKFIKSIRRSQEIDLKDKIYGEYNWDGKGLRIKKNFAFFQNKRYAFEKLTSNVYKIDIRGDIFIFIWDEEDEMLRVVRTKGEYNFIKRIMTGRTKKKNGNVEELTMCGEYDWGGKSLDFRKNHVFFQWKRYDYEKVASTVYTVQIGDVKYVFHWDKEDEVLGAVEVDGDEFFERIDKLVYVKKMEN